MDRLAFRIYDPVEKKFHYSGSTPMMLARYFKRTATLVTVQGMKHERFTGLLDKNGTEIYEGDILEFVVFEKTYRTKPVGWKQKFSHFGAGIALNEVLPEDLWVEDYDGNAVYKVTGNIHENPEFT